MTDVAGTLPVAEREQRVSALELFFDLVFVFAITQVTGFISAHPDVDGLCRGRWRSSSCCGGRGAATRGWATPRHPTTACSGSRCWRPWPRCWSPRSRCPHAFGDDALVFGVAYFVVRAAAPGGLPRAVARRPRRCAGSSCRLARSMLPASTLLVVAGLVDGDARGVLLGAGASPIDYGGLYVFGVEGWRVERGPPRRALRADHHHRAGRVDRRARRRRRAASGSTRGDHRRRAARRRGRRRAVVAYFDIVAIVAERRFRRARGRSSACSSRATPTPTCTCRWSPGSSCSRVGAQEDAGPHRAPAGDRPRGRAVRRRRAVPPRARRVPAAQRRTRSTGAARRRRSSCVALIPLGDACPRCGARARRASSPSRSCPTSTSTTARRASACAASWSA